MSLSYGKKTPSDGWIKVFRHYSGNGVYFSSANNWAEAKLSNPTNPNAEKFSILERIDNMKFGNEYIFKIYYPQNGTTNIWAQQNNPVRDIVTNGGVTGYRAISIDSTAQGWGGLEYNGIQTFFDGTVNTTNWYWAVASAYEWGGTGNFPGAGVAVNEVELYVKIRGSI
jgi:hypothetical protein